MLWVLEGKYKRTNVFLFCSLYSSMGVVGWAVSLKGTVTDTHAA